MSRRIRENTARFILITLSAITIWLAFINFQERNFSGMLINIGLSLLLFVDVFNPEFFLRPIRSKDFFEPESYSLNAKAGITALALGLVLVGITAKLIGFSFNYLN